jgi:putative transposase
MQLIAGRTGQEFNKRKRRGGAFWEVRYHATAVDSDEYLRRCMAYIDLKMVRAGVVDHPSKWLDSGYRAIQEPPQRYRVIDVEADANRMGYSGVVELQREQRHWVEEGLGSELFGRRDPCWTESLAVGGESYVDQVANELGMKSYHKQKNEQDGVFMIRESQAPYNAFF